MVDKRLNTENWWTALWGVVEQSSHLKYRQDKEDDCTFEVDQEQVKQHFHHGRSSGDGLFRSINTSVFTWSTDWTGDATLMLFVRRDRADFTF